MNYFNGSAILHAVTCDRTSLLRLRDLRWSYLAFELEYPHATAADWFLVQDLQCAIDDWIECGSEQACMI